MDAIVQAILNLSQLEVELIRITKATPTTYTLGIESKVLKTGPISSTMSAMTVDLVGPKGPYAKLSLPEVKTTSKGAQVNITDQLIEILDMEGFIAFVKSIQLDEKLTMRLDNGKGSVKALFGMTSQIVYKKDINILGMNGPATEIVKTEVLDDGTFKNTMKIVNPSPLEIDLGLATFQYIDAAGEVLAEQSGEVYIKRGETIYETTGKVIAKGNTDKVRFVGKAVAAESWVQETIKIYDVPITLTPELKSLLSA